MLRLLLESADFSQCRANLWSALAFGPKKRNMAAALPYHEPDILSIVILASFVLLVNFVCYSLDAIVYCGLVGQIFVGILFGTPGANWLRAETQDVIVQLGYLGLILVVYEGNLGFCITRLAHTLISRGRWDLNLICGVESQPLVIDSCGTDWHCPSHCPILLVERSLVWNNQSSSICSGCDSVLHELRHHFQRTQCQWIDQHSTWDRVGHSSHA